MEYSRLFQQMNNYYFSPKSNKEFDNSENEAIYWIEKGQKFLLQEDLQGVYCFQKALNSNPDNTLFWNLFALSLYEYGMTTEDDKSLHFASKCFRKSTLLNPDQFDVYLQWGSLLTEIGLLKKDLPSLQKAKELYQKAIKLSEDETKDKKADLFWQYGLVWLYIAQESGEAVDIRLALEALKKSENLQKSPSHDFWIDKGMAYLQMALLINETPLFKEAIAIFERAIETDPESALAFNFLAESYTGLYINTMDERHYNQASKAYSNSVKIDANQPNIWLEWARLICESGKLNNDSKKLRLSIEKCIKASSFDKENLDVIAQWTEALSLLGVSTNRLDLLLEAEEKIIEATEKEDGNPDLWYAYGICLTSFGKYYDETEFFELAIEKLQCGVSLNRTNAEIWQALAYAHTQIADVTEDPDLFERAGKFYRRAIDLKPCCPSLNFEYALNLSKHGELTLDQEILDEALLQYERTIQDQKESLLQHPEWLFHYGCTLDLMGEISEEKSYCIRSTEILLHILLIDPDYPKVYYHLALAFSHLAEYSSDTHLIERALSYFQLAASQDSEDNMVFLDWGLCLVHLAQQSIDSPKATQAYVEAEQKMIKSGQLGNIHAYYHLACLYSLLERYQEAMNFIYKADSNNVLPPIEELVTDDWLENLRHTESFEDFLINLESKKQKELP